MGQISSTQQTSPVIITFYHDIEQDIDSNASPKECRRMVKEFLALEKKYNIPATYNVVGKLFQEQPDLIQWIVEEGQEIAFHSYNHQPDWNSKYYSDEIDICRDFSHIPYGYRSPQSKIDQTAVKRIWEKGFYWTAESDSNQEPYFIYKGLVRLPISTDDWPLYKENVTAEEYIRKFREILKKKTYVAVGFHDTVASFAPEERLKIWEELLQIATETNALAVTFSEAADLFRRAAVSRYYNNTAQDWIRGTKHLYQTKRFQELIRGEAEKLNKPVVADLASGGGALSIPLANIAKRIYCVDNAPGMVQAVEKGQGIEAILGEVTDSNLPDHSIDLVICARIIEYMFWPDRLADEIKRIGKIGGTFLATFPAFTNPPPSNEGSPPDRIRRHFTAEEVREWAKQIGPGRLIGIQYESQEPGDPETEQRYRMTEINPPETPPTNWVYIGTIQNEYKQKMYRQTIPLSSATFRFPDMRIVNFKNYVKKVALQFPEPIRKIGKWVLSSLKR